MLEEVFELNMQLEELRANKKLGDADAELEDEVRGHQKKLQEQLDALNGELAGYWEAWDKLTGESASSDDRKGVLHKMVDLLNRRNYLRNLVRDVNELLDS